MIRLTIWMVLVCLAAGPAAAQMSAHSDDGYAVRAQLRSRNFAVLSAGISGEVVRMPVREGDRVAQGAVLAAMDCSTQVAARKVAEARLTAARAKSRVSDRLAELNSASVLEVELARSDVAQVVAELGAMDASLRKCEVRAPFAGLIVGQPARPHQFVREGDPLVELYDTGNMELELIVPSRWLEWLRPGASFAMTVDELGTSIKAVVDRVGGRVDPVSQTMRLIGRVEGGQKDLLPGMSGTATFERAEVAAKPPS